MPPAGEAVEYCLKWSESQLALLVRDGAPPASNEANDCTGFRREVGWCFKELCLLYREDLDEAAEELVVVGDVAVDIELL